MYRILSFNLLCAKWMPRAMLVAEIIRKYKPDSFGVQEAHREWMRYLMRNLPEYEAVGVGRNDGKKDGEYSAVFYLKNKFSASESGTFWLSETPDIPSKGWDGAHPRIATFVKLTDKATGKSYVHFNTHLDHVGRQAQLNGAEMIKNKAASFGSVPVVCTGDFNVEQDSNCYNVMVSGNMGDSRKLAPKTDTLYTYHGFNPEKHHAIIDFVFVDTATVTPIEFKVIDEKVNGKYYSDHHAVYADIELK